MIFAANGTGKHEKSIAIKQQHTGGIGGLVGRATAATRCVVGSTLVCRPHPRYVAADIGPVQSGDSGWVIHQLGDPMAPDRDPICEPCGHPDGCRDGS